MTFEENNGNTNDGNITSTNSKPSNSIISSFLRFVTSNVWSFFLFGILFVILGQTDAIKNIFEWILSRPANEGTVKAINGTFRTVGGALIGSGVFTSIIKSSEYSQVFSKILGEMLWSKEYIKKGGRAVVDHFCQIVNDQKSGNIGRSYQKKIGYCIICHPGRSL